MSHTFVTNYNTLLHNFSKKRTLCRIIFTANGHLVERYNPLGQVREYPPPAGFSSSLHPFKVNFDSLLLFLSLLLLWLRILKRIERIFAIITERHKLQKQWGEHCPRPPVVGGPEHILRFEMLHPRENCYQSEVH